CSEKSPADHRSQECPLCSCSQVENPHFACVLAIGGEFHERTVFCGIDDIIEKRPTQSVGGDNATRLIDKSLFLIAPMSAVKYTDQTRISEAAMLMDLLSWAATVAMLSFVVSSMLARGTGPTVARITEPLRNVGVVLLTLLANFILVPIGAGALAKVLRLDETFRVRLLLLGCAAGAPFLPKLAERAKGNPAFAVSTMLPLMAVTVGYCPSPF